MTGIAVYHLLEPYHVAIEVNYRAEVCCCNLKRSCRSNGHVAEKLRSFFFCDPYSFIKLQDILQCYLISHIRQLYTYKF